MGKSYLILIAFCLFQRATQELTPDADCSANLGTSRGLKLSLKRAQNQTGDWVDVFTARAECSNSSDCVDMFVTHRVIDCGGKRVVYMQGVSKANPVEFIDGKGKKTDKITFHPRCGKNVAIGANGRTVEKINLGDPYHSAVFTNRPLKDNEWFEVKIEKQNERPEHSMGIGIISRTPSDIEFFPEMYKSPFCWIYHNVNVYSNGAVIFKNYGRNTMELRVGDRVGVMRNPFGTLRFSANGVDLGPAASNVPSEVYGVFELWGNAPKAAIVDEPSPPSS